MNLHVITAAVAALAFAAALPAAGAGVPERWYDTSRVESGAKVYASNCAVCHGARGEATADWRRREPDGSFPPAAAQRHGAYVAPPVRDSRAADQVRRARRRRQDAHLPGQAHRRGDHQRHRLVPEPVAGRHLRAVVVDPAALDAAIEIDSRTEKRHPRAPRGRGGSLREAARRRRRRLRDPPPAPPACETGTLPPGRGAAASYRGQTERARPRPNSGARRRAFRQAHSKSPLGVCVSPYWSLARREYPGIEGVPPSNEGKMPSIPALPARSSPPVPTFEEPFRACGGDASPPGLPSRRLTRSPDQRGSGWCHSCPRHLPVARTRQNLRYDFRPWPRPVVPADHADSAQETCRHVRRARLVHQRRIPARQ